VKEATAAGDLATARTAARTLAELLGSGDEEAAAVVDLNAERARRR
jgi:hypothetical protein